MRSNYKPLGKYIQPVVGRNNDLGDLPLVGLSIQKKFIRSIANTIGTDMSIYRIIEKKQFAYGPVTSRNGGKITIALFNDYEKALISQAYIPFEVKDTDELDPEYLMMWFCRPEFDRYARFKSHGSAREIFDWEEMCNTLLPIPTITKQREIVKEHNVIQNRIAINQQLIQKLEETAQAIYKQWFVDFEFPDENGLPYKSNGGEMLWNEELGKEIPMGWRLGTLEDLYNFQYGMGNNNPDNGGEYPVYGSNGIIGSYSEFNNQNAPVIGHIGANCGLVVFAFGKHYVTYNGVMCIAKSENQKWFSYLSLLSKDLMSQTRGSSQPFVSYDMLYEIKAIIPFEDISMRFDSHAYKLYLEINLKIKETQKLLEIRDLLLSKLATIEN
jgi:type I restriction enzyme S subunit